MVYDNGEEKLTFVEELIQNIDYLKLEIKPIVKDIFHKNRKSEPRIYFISAEELGLILLEIINPKFPLDNFNKLFPEIDKFLLPDSNKISGFISNDGTTYKFLKEESLINTNPLKHMNSLTETIN